jgi:gas vesicle protein
MTTKSKIILGLVGAAAAGVVVGLLLAPDKGTELRSKISQKAGDWTDQLTDIFANAKGEITELAKRGSKVATDAASTVTDKFNSAKESYS